MSTLYWLRVARKVTGLYKQPEYANLEALLEAEAAQPHYDFRVLSIVIPAALGAVSFGASIFAIATKSPGVAFSAVGLAGSAGLVWFVFNRLDRKIHPAKAKIRNLSEQLVRRISKFTNIVGVDPAISPRVAELLDQASAIYLKHSRTTPTSEHYAKGIEAIEVAMARLMDLAAPTSAQAQEIELSRGWSQPLLQEMKQLDQALDRHLQEPQHSADPLYNLREARLDLERVNEAVAELEQHNSL